MTQANQEATRAVIPALVRKAVSFELGVWRSLYRWTMRRPRVPDTGAEAFSYAGAVAPLLWVFIAVSAIEVPVAHLILPWATARVIVLALGVWGLTWMLGLLASLKVHPHIVGDSGLRIRYGTTVDITIPWDAIATIRVDRHDLPKSRTVQLSRTQTGTVLHIGIASQTNVHVVLHHSVTVPLPKGHEPITELRFYADDPRALVDRARRT